MKASVLVLDPHVTLVQPPQPQRPKVDVPDPIRNLLQPDVLAHTHDRDVHPGAWRHHRPQGDLNLAGLFSCARQATPGSSRSPPTASSNPRGARRIGKGTHR